MFIVSRGAVERLMELWPNFWKKYGYCRVPNQVYSSALNCYQRCIKRLSQVSRAQQQLRWKCHLSGIRASPLSRCAPTRGPTCQPGRTGPRTSPRTRSCSPSASCASRPAPRGPNPPRTATRRIGLVFRNMEFQIACLYDTSELQNASLEASGTEPRT